MTQDIKNAWSALTDLTVTNLASLAAGNWWQSGRLTNPSPSYDLIEIFWEIVYSSAPPAGDYLWWKLIAGDGGSLGNEIWGGGIGASEGQITSAAAIAEVDQAGMGWQHNWMTSHGATFKDGRQFPLFAQDFQLLVSPRVIRSLASGTHRVRVRFGNSQLQ